MVPNFEMRPLSSAVDLTAFAGTIGRVGFTWISLMCSIMTSFFELVRNWYFLVFRSWSRKIGIMFHSTSSAWRLSTSDFFSLLFCYERRVYGPIVDSVHRHRLVFLFILLHWPSLHADVCVQRRVLASQGENCWSCRHNLSILSHSMLSLITSGKLPCPVL